MIAMPPTLYVSDREDLTAGHPDIDLTMIASWLRSMPRSQALAAIDEYIHVTAHNAHVDKPDNAATRESIDAMAEGFRMRLKRHDLLPSDPAHWAYNPGNAWQQINKRID